MPPSTSRAVVELRKITVRDGKTIRIARYKEGGVSIGINSGHAWTTVDMTKDTLAALLIMLAHEVEQWGKEG